MSIIHDTSFIRIYFGDADDHLSKQEYLTWQDTALLLAQPSMQSVIKQLQVQKLFFLRQIHSTEGYHIALPMESFEPFTWEGDYLITGHSTIGLGIMAADCLPVICCDTKNRVIGIAHAGWRGALTGVIQKMLEHMQGLWHINIKKCDFFFGPSARQCCYQVGPEFEQYLAGYSYKWQVLQKRHNNYFFDTSLFVSYQLQTMGIAQNAIYTAYNTCTICNDRFYSHRRSVAHYSGRQMTVVALK